MKYEIFPDEIIVPFGGDGKGGNGAYLKYNVAKSNLSMIYNLLFLILKNKGLSALSSAVAFSKFYANDFSLFYNFISFKNLSI